MPIISTSQITTSPSATVADPGNASEIESLTQRVHDFTQRVQNLTQSVAGWNKAILWSLVGAAVTGIVVVLATYMAFRRARDLADAQSDLGNVKGGLLQAQLQERDFRIAKAQSDASNAQTEIARDEVKIAQANTRTEELKAQNLATEARLEDERNTRLKLEQTLAPRVIFFGGAAAASNIDLLTPFSGIEAEIDVVPDAEAERAANQIESLIQSAGWKVTAAFARNELNVPPSDGVVVNPAYPVETEEYLQGSRAKHAADALVKVLTGENWQARTQYANSRSTVKPNTIRINVGFKPSPYFDEKMRHELGIPDPPR